MLVDLPQIKTKNLAMIETDRTQNTMTIGKLVTSFPIEDVNTWPLKSKKLALQAIEKYGLPDILGFEVLIWRRKNFAIVIDKNQGLLDTYISD